MRRRVGRKSLFFADGGPSRKSPMPRKQRLKDEDGENVERPSGLLPSKRIARKPRKQRLKDEDEEEDDELPSGLLPSSRRRCSGRPHS